MHTPGPWTSTELAAAIVPGFAYGVGHDPLGPSGVAWPIALAVTPDDARLIAAAPKLLEALEDARGAININNPAGPGWPALLAKMGDAIAEAKGE